MTDPTFTDLFGFGEDSEPKVKDPIAVLQTLMASPCFDCRLGYEHRNNPGYLWKGNPQGEVAVVGDHPSVGDLSSRKAFADMKGNELKSWIRRTGLSEDQIFYTYIVQCPTPLNLTSKIATEREKQRSLHSSEVDACFPNRAIRVLKAMPNLKVVWALGLQTHATLLGGEPRAKSHFGFWFGTDLLPDVAVFCLPHPRDFDKETSQLKRGRLKQCLLYFANEYFGVVRDGKQLCPSRKALDILQVRQQERRNNRKAAELSF